ncbi:DUF5642 family protein [Mycolicibacterium sediminis]|uniref:DUF5642 domain-containing protein n=1 Tax=Mycolicibacterium sediminis TaxID=1286180 RepID=A0A7I7R0B1_9MYCO|nr:DUF5642 family protein [Mycolicibacterium sediminis]BBY31657.1 hypothetical protein MSEDJ_57530 [Mycolicibacterium sediminis]
MRVFAACLAVLTCVACGEPGPPSAPPASPEVAAPVVAAVDPARVVQSRSEVPAGFEFADVAGRVAPVAQWGLGPAWTANPPTCAALGNPAVDEATVRGWSASGPGAIVYAVAAAVSAGLDTGVLGDCERFAVAAGHTTGAVSIVDGPPIADVPTVGLRAETVTVVEGGTETRSHAETFAAYPAGHVVYVTVVSDPGSGDSVLGPGFAARLLAGTTSAVRGVPVAGG